MGDTPVNQIAGIFSEGKSANGMYGKSAKTVAWQAEFVVLPIAYC